MSTRCMSCEGQLFVSEFDHRTNPGENGRQCQESKSLFVRWGWFSGDLDKDSVECRYVTILSKVEFSKAITKS
jgi:hypothetical protein